MHNRVTFEVDLADNDEYFVRQKHGGRTEMFSETYAGRTIAESRRKAIAAAERMAARIQYQPDGGGKFEPGAVVKVINPETGEFEAIDG